ncbi:MAG: hypothetical protein LBI72_06535 [Flavobacteriaceae bacterium]|jgi:hypothetical protein|nr:hypothetical protein [Flavobacteriaceae bacterium]
MKKIFTLAGLSLATLFVSCNDGDIVYKDINFDQVTNVEYCNNGQLDPRIYFKINKDEALILQINAKDIMRDETIKEQNVQIDGSNTALEYRKYSGKVEGRSICNTPPPAFPNVLQQIPATPGGLVNIRRDVSIKNTQATDYTKENTVALTYQYTFTLLNISFIQGDISMKYDRMLFGTTNYANRVFDFKFLTASNKLKELNPCGEKLLVLSDKEAMQLNLKTADLPKEEGTITFDLNDARTLTFKQYQKTGINSTQVCENDGNIPGLNGASPNILEEQWIAKAGKVVINSKWTEPIEGGTKYLQHEITIQNSAFVKKGVDYLTFYKNILPFGTIRTL